MPFEIGPLAAALVFSAIFLLGSHVLIPEAIRRHRRRILSFGAGVTIAYVFVHLLPELEAAREALGHNEARMALPVFSLRVYLAALVGFMAFYALKQMIAKAHRPADPGTPTAERTVSAGRSTPRVSWPMSGWPDIWRSGASRKGRRRSPSTPPPWGSTSSRWTIRSCRNTVPGTIARSVMFSPSPRWPDGRWGFSWNSARSSRRPSWGSSQEGSS